MKNVCQCYILAVLTAPWSFACATAYDATIHFADRVTLSTPVSGIIESVHVVTGQRVRAGETLVELEQTPFSAAQEQASAALAIRATQKREGVRDFELAQELYDRTVLSNVELENARLKADRATASFKAAQAELATSNYNLTHAKIVAPFDGLVVKLYAKAYESINNTLQTQPLLVFAAPGKYTANTYAPFGALASLHIGLDVNVTIDKRTFTAKVISVALEPSDTRATNGEAHYEVIAEFETDDPMLRAGQTARIDLP